MKATRRTQDGRRTLAQGLAMAALVAAVGLAALPADAAWPWTSGNGEARTEVRKLEGFDQLQVDGPVDVRVTEGGPFRVEVTADSNLLARVETKVEGRTLVVDVRGSIRTKTPLRMSVTLPRLDAATSRGSGDLDIQGSQAGRPFKLVTQGSGEARFRGPATRLDASASGSGDLRVDLSAPAEQVSIVVMGSGDAVVTGPGTTALDARSTGSGDLQLKGLTARSARLTSTGSGDIEATLDGGPLELRATGSGDVRWWGKAEVSRLSASGSGRLQHQD